MEGDVIPEELKDGGVEADLACHRALRVRPLRKHVRVSERKG